MNRDERKHEKLTKDNTHFLGLRLIELYKTNKDRYFWTLEDLKEEFGLPFYDKYLKWHEKQLENDVPDGPNKNT